MATGIGLSCTFAQRLGVDRLRMDRSAAKTTAQPMGLPGNLLRWQSGGHNVSVCLRMTVAVRDCWSTVTTKISVCTYPVILTPTIPHGLSHCLSNPNVIRKRLCKRLDKHSGTVPPK